MRYPEFLKEGGTIGFVAPSFGCNTEPYHTAFEHALEVFTEMGLSVDLGPNCFEGSGIGISNTPELCAQELEEYYCSPDNDILISCGGGELMCEDLNYIDFDRIAAAPPKWFMGLSDNTNFTFLLTTLCDTASIYGPCAAAFGMEPWHASISDAFCILTGESPAAAYKKWKFSDTRNSGQECYAGENEEYDDSCTDQPEQSECRDEFYAGPSAETGENDAFYAGRQEEAGSYESFGGKPEGNSVKSLTICGYPLFQIEGLKDEENPLLPYNVTEPSHPLHFPDEDIYMEGRMIGGCMDVLTLFLGTPFDKVEEFAEKYSKDGILWFLESCDLNPMGMRRALWQMEQAGWFQHVRGFLIGRPLHHGEEILGLNQYDAVLGVLAKYDVPILMDLDIGHLPPTMPLICGSYAKVHARDDDVVIEMELR